MHPTQRSPITTSAMKKLAAAVASSLVLMSASHAAGLGKLTVLSALGQPLRAEIELTAASGEDAAGVVAKLASPDAFKAANIDFNPALLSLRFNVEQRGGRQFVRVSSIQPLNEPFVDMLLELSWNNGRIVREYTFLLDPAELRGAQSAQVAPGEAQAPARARADAAAPALPAADESMRARGGRLRPAPEAPRAPAESAPAAAGRAAAGEYRVKAGDSLGRIAAQLKPVDVSLDMMLVALYRANPDAFMGNNMNRLKSGRVLAVPGLDAIRATGDADAHGIVIAHAADFNAYRSKLAGQVATAEPVQTPPATQSAAGKVTAKVEERPTAANEAQDKLHLSKAAPSAVAGKGTTSSTEDVIAQQKELEDARARIKELERNVGAVEKLVTLQNKAGAEAQQKAEGAKAEQKPAATTPEAPAKPVDVKPATKKLPAIKPAKPAPAPEPGIFDFIMDNLPLVGGVGALALLGGLLAAQRRKKKDAVPPAAPSILNVPTEPQHSLFAETGGQSVDTNNSVFNSSFAPSASQLDTNEVDPVAEADVYIAYGRDAQAEEILKEALRLHPERTPVRLKLLEIYAARKDLRAFETQAGELYAITRGQGDDWAQAAALGRSIDPTNALYANGGQAVSTPSPQEAGQQALLAREAALGAGAAAAVAAAHEPLGFEQHFAEALGAAQPAAQPPAPEPAPAHEDEHLLDFDLGGLSFEPVTADGASAAASAPAVPNEDAATDVHEIDFDMSPFADAEPTALPAAPAPAPAAEPARADLDDLAFDLDAFAPPAVAPAPEPAPVPAAEVSDFDFDLDAFAPPAAAPAPAAAPEAPAAAPVPAAEAPLDFAFDMDFGDAPAAQPAAPADEPAFTAEPLPGGADHGIDLAGLAREFDLEPAVPPAAPEPAIAAAPAAEPNEPLFDLDAMDFGLHADPVPAAAPAAAARPEPAPTPDDHFLDFPEPAAANAEPAPSFARKDQPAQHYDFGGFELDVPAGEDVAPLPDAEASTADATPAATAPDELSPEHMEMETKLDLALAYQEIGDKEGARELLEEVIKGGSNEQATRANALRAALV